MGLIAIPGLHTCFNFLSKEKQTELHTLVSGSERGLLTVQRGQFDGRKRDQFEESRGQLDRRFLAVELQPTERAEAGEPVGSYHWQGISMSAREILAYHDSAHGKRLPRMFAPSNAIPPILNIFLRPEIENASLSPSSARARSSSSSLAKPAASP